MAEFLNIQDALNALEITEGMTAAEFGCGSAAFAMALAKKLKRGRVYALDIQPEKLSALRGKMAIGKINNIYPIVCDLEAPNGSTLHEGSLDIILIPNVLFQIENKHAIIEEAFRVLKSGGQLLIVDWLKSGPFSPKGGMISPEELKKIADSLGLKLQKEFATGDYHFGLLFTK